jgi:hypothetical protein
MKVTREIRRWLVIVEDGTCAEYISLRARYSEGDRREALRVARVKNLPDAQIREAARCGRIFLDQEWAKVYSEERKRELLLEYLNLELLHLTGGEK